ncbi:MAG: hypothetical protein RIA71_02100 [Oceanicaulis sp.]
MDKPYGLCSASADVEHLGAGFRVAPNREYVVFTFHSFRSEAKGEEGFSFLLENYLEQPSRCVVFDVRNALWPSDMVSLQKRFANHASRLPLSRVAGLCGDPQSAVMKAALIQFKNAGHVAMTTSCEAEAVDWLCAGAQACLDPERAKPAGLLHALGRLITGP